MSEDELRIDIELVNVMHAFWIETDSVEMNTIFGL